MNSGRDFNFFSYANPPNWQNVSTTSRHDESIGDIMDSVRELLTVYNDNIRAHNHIIDGYNSNIFNILNILQTLLDFYLLHQRVPNNQTRNYTNNTAADLRNTFNPTMRRRTGNENRSNLDISSLIYLLSTPTFELPLPNNSGLTHLQIDEFTQNIRYNDSMNESRCAITLDEFINNEEVCQIRACGHYFKRSALLRWFDRHNVCPVCRCNLTMPLPATPSNYQNIDLSMNVPNEIQQNVEPDLVPLFSSSNIPNSPSTRNSLPVNHLTPIFENLFNSFTQNQLQTNTTSNNVGYQQLARIISDALLDQSPVYDSSQNLLFTLEIPLPDSVSNI